MSLLYSILAVFCFILIPIEKAFCSVHGGTIVAIAGKDAVVLATDSRFSSHQTGAFMIGSFRRQVFHIGKNIIVGFDGLESHSSLLMDSVRLVLADQHFDFIEPYTAARVISDLLYEKKLSCRPILAGLGAIGAEFVMAFAN